MILLDELVAGTRGVLTQRGTQTSFSGFCFDFRRAQPGELFVALVTPTGDGHAYVDEAIAAGVTGVMCQHAIDAAGHLSIVVVDDTSQALLAYARYLLEHRELTIVAVTGSVGKTSTKEMVASILAQRWSVFRTPQSYNGRLGLPIALGLLEPEHDHAVFELGADALGEIAELAALARPHVGIITNVGESHLAAFGSRQAIQAEKATLLSAIVPGGAAVLNADDPLVSSMSTSPGIRRLLVGETEKADLGIVDTRVSWHGTTVILREADLDVTLRTRLLGRHQAHTIGLAAAAARFLGIDWELIASGVAGCQPQEGRLMPLQGFAGSRLLDDTYNASPKALFAALDLLATLPARRRVLVLGDMTELGSQALAYHEMAGKRAARSVDRLITLGDLAARAGQVALESGLGAEQVVTCHTHQDAVQAARQTLGQDDVVLVKGSAAMRLEEVVRGLIAELSLSTTLLTRQHAAYDQAHLRMPDRPAWIEVDSQAIANNTRLLKQLVGNDVALMAVLKADAYGHGAVRVACTALNNGASWLGIASLNEAVLLREAGITAPLLVLGYTPPWQAREALRHDVAVALYDLGVARALAQAARDTGLLARAHLKIDTGMGRLGLFPEEVASFLEQARALSGLRIEGVFSHLSTADEVDLEHTLGQIKAFQCALDTIARAGCRPDWVHLANSAATLRLPQTHYNLVRVGIALYGLASSVEVALPEGFKPALSLKCQVAQVKSVPAGSAVGYGRAFVASRATRVAVIPIGYADGFRRSPRNWGEVLVRGRRAPIIGNVCMDQTMLDVTDIPGVKSGDEVVLIGEQGRESISVDDVARQLGTINYEVVSELLARVPRIV